MVVSSLIHDGLGLPADYCLSQQSAGLAVSSSNLRRGCLRSRCPRIVVV
jgi:hypothetical protein